MGSKVLTNNPKENDMTYAANMTREQALTEVTGTYKRRIERLERQLAAVVKGTAPTPGQHVVKVGMLYVSKSGHEVHLTGAENATRFKRDEAIHISQVIRNGHNERGALVHVDEALRAELADLQHALAEIEALRPAA